MIVCQDYLHLQIRSPMQLIDRANKKKKERKKNIDIIGEFHKPFQRLSQYSL